ncbi:UNVERIFIED_ORG: hypothetical protein M2414_000031 [Rahnella aquatilis]
MWANLGPLVRGFRFMLYQKTWTQENKNIKRGTN